MHFVGDIHIYVSDFDDALRFWAEGLQLKVSEKEVSANSAYARLDFAEGGSSIRLMGPVEPWDPEMRPPIGVYPTVLFDITTTDFDTALLRLMDNGGQQLSEIETYEGLRSVTLADPDGNLFELLEIHDDVE